MQGCRGPSCSGSCTRRRSCSRRPELQLPPDGHPIGIHHRWGAPASTLSFDKVLDNLFFAQLAPASENTVCGLVLLLLLLLLLLCMFHRCLDMDNTRDKE